MKIKQIIGGVMFSTPIFGFAVFAANSLSKSEAGRQVVIYLTGLIVVLGVMILGWKWMFKL